MDYQLDARARFQLFSQISHYVSVAVAKSYCKFGCVTLVVVFAPKDESDTCRPCLPTCTVEQHCGCGVTFNEVRPGKTVMCYIPIPGWIKYQSYIWALSDVISVAFPYTDMKKATSFSPSCLTFAFKNSVARSPKMFKRLEPVADVRDLTMYQGTADLVAEECFYGCCMDVALMVEEYAKEQYGLLKACYFIDQNPNRLYRELPDIYTLCTESCEIHEHRASEFCASRRKRQKTEVHVTL